MSTWKIDTVHSRIEFKVKHLVVTTLGGHFSKFDATAESNSNDFNDAKISFEADVDSISTNNEQRDGHLKSDVFFDAAKYPKLKFVSTGIKKIDAESFKLIGNLTIRDKTLPVTLDVAHGGTAMNFQSKTVAGFELTGKINRKDFGLTWSATTETGNIVLGDEVKLVLAVEMIKQD
jgi:polyisoprenoid-binding protein YceI